MERFQIEAVIPHRAPFLLVDRIVELEPGRRAVGLKLVSPADHCFLVDLNGRRVMPGSIILEAMAQVGAVAVLCLPEYKGKATLLAGIENARFYKEVVLGEEIRMEVEIVKLKKTVGKRKCQAMVGEMMVAEAILLFVLADRGAVDGGAD